MLPSEDFMGLDDYIELERSTENAPKKRGEIGGVSSGSKSSFRAMIVKDSIVCKYRKVTLYMYSIVQ